MGLFSKLIRKSDPSDLPIPKTEKQYYQKDSYYTDYDLAGNKVIRLAERKKSSYPSKNGLYVPEILLLSYCGKYPNPKSGYQAFWWFKYGIRNVGAVLDSLMERGFIELDQTTGKYKLTELGKQEIRDNEYVEFMHKNSKFADFTAWEMNQELANKDNSNYLSIAADHGIYTKDQQTKRTIEKGVPAQKKRSFENSIERDLYNSNPEYRRMKDKIDYEDELLEKLNYYVALYKSQNNIEALISAYEDAFVVSDPPCRSTQVFDLINLYINQGMLDKAWELLNRIILLHPDKLCRIRKEQCRILKKEGKYIEALRFISLSTFDNYGNKNSPNKQPFLKDVSPIIKKLSVDNTVAEELWTIIESELKNKKSSEATVEAKISAYLKDKFGIS
ncbi:hypothetical protein SAMN02910317_02857 [Ruminococcaceae bacterium FB2012]|nr:hypothetical protein SAMN02910317_02857 [Ruminococcaceae bacterium FB2012]